MEELTFPKNSFKSRLKTMLRVDFRRILKSPFFYIVVASCLVMPILITVMITMMEGTVPQNPQTGLPGEPIKGFESAWQILGSVAENSQMGAAGGAAMAMDIVSMCNINMLYFLLCVLVCVFVSDDFRSGYAKNLFTVRSDKKDYVISKTIVCIFGSALMIFAFFIGSLLGGVMCSLPFEMIGFDLFGLIMSVLSKMVLVSVFVPIYLVMAVIAKGRAWLSILLSMGVGMFLFMMVPMLTPLNATPVHLILCLVGGAIFSVGLGAVSNIILKKTALV